MIKNVTPFLAKDAPPATRGSSLNFEQKTWLINLVIYIHPTTSEPRRMGWNRHRLPPLLITNINMFKQHPSCF